MSLLEMPMQREVNMDRPCENRLHIDYSTCIHFNLYSTNHPGCCFVAIFSWRKPPGSRIIRKLWSNTCERTQSFEKEQAEDSSKPKSIVVVLRKTAEKLSRDRRQSHGCTTRLWSPSVWTVQNKDIWIGPTNLSRHYRIVVINRTLPFENCRERSSAGWGARDEAKKHKIQEKSQIKDTGIRLGSQSYWRWYPLRRHSRRGHPWRRECRLLWQVTIFHHWCHLPFWLLNVRLLSFVLLFQKHDILSCFFCVKVSQWFFV